MTPNEIIESLVNFLSEEVNQEDYGVKEVDKIYQFINEYSEHIESDIAVEVFHVDYDTYLNELEKEDFLEDTSKETHSELKNTPQHKEYIDSIKRKMDKFDEEDSFDDYIEPENPKFLEMLKSYIDLLDEVHMNREEKKQDIQERDKEFNKLVEEVAKALKDKNEYGTLEVSISESLLNEDLRTYEEYRKKLQNELDNLNVDIRNLGSALRDSEEDNDAREGTKNR